MNRKKHVTNKRWPRRGAASAVALGILSLSGAAARGEPQATAPVDNEASSAYQISVSVDLVVLNPVVHDRSGGFVNDLGERNFQVFEDGSRQNIRLFRHDDLPVTVGLIVDHSASMGRKLNEVITAARAFVKSSNPDDEMFVVNFNEKVTLGLPAATAFTNRPDELERAILATRVEGQTALYDAVIEAQRRLLAGSREKKVLIVISDGGDNASSHHLAEALKIAEESGAVVYTIGIFDAEDADSNPGVLRHLARVTGGDAYFPEQLDEVTMVCERIARDIRNQYTIGYVSTATVKPGAWRSIRVAAKTTANNKLLVRARAGYIAGGAALAKSGGGK